MLQLVCNNPYSSEIDAPSYVLQLANYIHLLESYNSEHSVFMTQTYLRSESVAVTRINTETQYASSRKNLSRLVITHVTRTSGIMS